MSNILGAHQGVMKSFFKNLAGKFREKISLQVVFL